MFWYLYIFSVCCFCYLLSSFLNGSINRLLILSCLIVLLTPAQIEAGVDGYAPAIFTFLYNTLLENNYSLRPLRPVLLSLSVSLLFLGIFTVIKRKFF
jgi:hypothetical protein